jgi:recombinational DNA repair protein (RecF pathway)
LKTLTGARLIRHFGKITVDMQRMNQAFEALKIVNKLSEDGAGQEYFDILASTFTALDDAGYDPRLIEIWLGVRLLSEAGTMPNITAANNADARFEYDHSTQSFVEKPDGQYGLNDLKLLKLSATQSKPLRLQSESGSEDQLLQLIKLLLKTNLTEV